MLAVAVACTPGITAGMHGSSSLAAASPGDPGGLGGFFSVACHVARVARDDPIVHPDTPGASHLHDFFGPRSITAFSTPKSLLGKPTSCDNTGDTAGYWTPSPTMSGVPVRPGFQNEYWFDGGFKHVSTIPFGLELVAGNSMATTPQPLSHVFYYCGQSPVNTVHSSLPYDCSNSNDTTNHEIIMVVVFPQCWDGKLPSGNDASHVAYPVKPGVCPQGFSHPLPRLEEHVHTFISSPFVNGKFVFHLSSGSAYSLHGDFMNAWRPATLLEFVTECINAHLHCAPSVTP